MVRSAYLIGVLTLLSRLTGLLRERVQAHFLGTGVAADAFRYANLIPNMLRRLVGEGAVTSIFVAVYSQRVKDDPEEARVFTEKFLTFWFCLVAAITVMGVILVGPLLFLLRPLFADGALGEVDNLALTVDLSRIVFWYLLLVGSMAAIQGVLHARWKFGAAASVSALFNLVFVGATFLLVPLFPPEKVVFAISFAVLVGGAAQVGVLATVLRRHGVRFRFVNPLHHEGVRDVLRLMVPGTLGAGVYQLNVAVNTIIAGRLEEGSVAALGYSNRFMEFVLGIFVFALGTVSLTSLSRLSAVGDRAGFAARSTETLRLVLFITVPSTVGLYLVQEPMISMILSGGEFGASSLTMTLAAFRFHVLGLAFVGVSRVLVASFHAEKNLRTPLVVSVCVLPINIILAFILSEGTLRHGGIALAATVTAAAQAVCLLVLFGYHVRLRVLSFGWFLAKAAVCATIMGAACIALKSVLPVPVGKLAQLTWLSALVVTGIFTFFAAAELLRMPECRTLLRSLRRR